jgi:hypothetical protein
MYRNLPHESAQKAARERVTRATLRFFFSFSLFFFAEFKPSYAAYRAGNR